MMLDFLKRLKSARQLDKDEFKRRFPQGRQKADFLLFGGRAVCEVKEIRSVQMASRIERLWKKGALPKEVFERELHSSIRSVLREANNQVADTKRVLDIQDAFGLVILENLMPNVMSGPMLLYAADKEMLSGLDNVDCTLCLDFVNGYREQDGNLTRFARTLRRGDKRSEVLCELLNPLVKDFCQDANLPFIEQGSLSKVHLTWFVDANGKYVEHGADFR